MLNINLHINNITKWNCRLIFSTLNFRKTFRIQLKKKRRRNEEFSSQGLYIFSWFAKNITMA